MYNSKWKSSLSLSLKKRKVSCKDYFEFFNTSYYKYIDWEMSVSQGAALAPLEPQG